MGATGETETGSTGLGMTGFVTTGTGCEEASVAGTSGALLIRPVAIARADGLGI